MKKMKFLLGALSFVAAALMVAPSQAQIKTYISEDFSNGLNPSVWDVDACTPISAKVGPLYLVQTSDVDFWGGWIYDPNGSILEGGAPDQLDGDYEIVAQPIQLESDAINMISVNYMYWAQSSGTRSFGIRVREEDSTAWTEIGKLTSMGTNKESMLVATLDSKWNGKKVVVEVYFSAKHKANSAYYFLMGEIKFAAYSKEPNVSTKFSSAPVAYGKNYDVKLTISNIGAVPVNSLEYAYVIDDNAKTGTIPASFNTALEPLTGMAGGTVQLDIDGLQFGEHTIKFRLSQINGEDVTVNDEETLVFYLVDESKLTPQYVPLFEGFTSSTCPPCATANSYFNPVLAQLQNEGAINVIKYQMNFPGNGDPYYIAGNQTRMQYYDGIFGWDNYWTVPSPIYNGMENILEWNAQYWSDIAGQLKDKATDDHKKKAVMAIDITKAEVDLETKKINLELTVTSSLNIKGRVFAIVVEKTTTGNKGTNGEKEFHNVTMKFANNAAGVEKLFVSGEPESFSYTALMKSSKVEEMTDLQIVCFVQDETSGYIFQSASRDVFAVANEANEVMGDVRVYPNPASEFVNITNLEGADVEIFDLTGRRVYAHSKVEGDLEIALASFANGTYVVRLTKDGQSAHRKLMVVR